MSRYARRIDDNQPDIVATFRALGCKVTVMSHLGHGFPDLVVERGGRVRFVEVKDGSKPPSAQNLTDDEKVFQGWMGEQYVVINSGDAAYQMVAEMMLKSALEANCSK